MQAVSGNPTPLDSPRKPMLFFKPKKRVMLMVSKVNPIVL